MKKKICGANNRQGSPCQQPPVYGKSRCRFHGGLSTGAPKANQNAVTHGIYSSKLTLKEEIVFEGIELGTVDNELRLCRVRLVRALMAESLANDAIELESYTEQDATLAATPIKIGAQIVATKNFRRRDFNQIINGLVARIESLEKTRAELFKNDTGANRHDPVTRIEIEVVGGNF